MQLPLPHAVIAEAPAILHCPSAHLQRESRMRIGWHCMKPLAKPPDTLLLRSPNACPSELSPLVFVPSSSRSQEAAKQLQVHPHGGAAAPHGICARLRLPGALLPAAGLPGIPAAAGGHFAFLTFVCGGGGGGISWLLQQQVGIERVYPGFYSSHAYIHVYLTVKGCAAGAPHPCAGFVPGSKDVSSMLSALAWWLACQLSTTERHHITHRTLASAAAVQARSGPNGVSFSAWIGSRPEMQAVLASIHSNPAAALAPVPPVAWPTVDFTPGQGQVTPDEQQQVGDGGFGCIGAAPQSLSLLAFLAWMCLPQLLLP